MKWIGMEESIKRNSPQDAGAACIILCLARGSWLKSKKQVLLTLQWKFQTPVTVA